MIGKNICDIRKRRGLTLSELADRASISKSYLSNIERNINQNPSIRVMKKIATVLDVELKTLLATGKDVDQGKQHLEEEWLDFVKELKESGIEKEQIPEFKTLIEFVKWKKGNLDSKK